MKNDNRASALSLMRYLFVILISGISISACTEATPEIKALYSENGDVSDTVVTFTLDDDDIDFSVLGSSLTLSGSCSTNVDNAQWNIGGSGWKNVDSPEASGASDFDCSDGTFNIILLSPQVNGLSHSTSGDEDTVAMRVYAGDVVSSELSVTFRYSPIGTVITSITSSTPDDSYNQPDVISITVTFSEPITVSVIPATPPSLNMDTGGTAAYVSAGASSLEFTYTVGLGENSSDLDVSGISLGTYTVTNAGLSPVDITLPIGGSGNTLAENSDIIIDNTAPSVPGMAFDTPASSPNQDVNPSFNLTGLEVGTEVYIWVNDGTCTFAGEDTSFTASSATESYVPAANPLTEAIHDFYVVAKDAAGNESSCSAGVSYEVDLTAPSIPSNLAVTSEFSEDALVDDFLDSVSENPNIVWVDTAPDESDYVVEIFDAPGGASLCSSGSLGANAVNAVLNKASCSLVNKRSYYYEITISDVAGNTDTTSGNFNIDAPWGIPTSGLTSWFDASDSNLRIEGGGTVSQLYDRSFAFTHATQGTLANQPTIVSASINSLDTLDFDGINDVLVSGANSDLDNDAMTTIVYTKGDITGTPKGNVFNFEYANSNFGVLSNLHEMLGFAMEDGAPTNFVYGLTSSNTSSTAGNGSTPATLSNPSLWAIRFGASGTNLVQLYKDAAVSPSYSTANDINVEPNTHETFSIGAGVNNGSPFDFFNGEIGEVINYNRALSDGELDLVENYFLNKWVPITPITWIGAARHGDITVSGGDLVSDGTSVVGSLSSMRANSTFAQTSGKYYFEVTYTALIDNPLNTRIGICNLVCSTANLIGADTNSWAFEIDSGKAYHNSGAGSSYGSSLSVSDVIGVAVDLDNGNIWFTNAAGTYPLSGNPATNLNPALTGITGSIVPAVSHRYRTTFTTNFGGSAFTHSVPSGFTAGWPQ